MGVGSMNKNNIRYCLVVFGNIMVFTCTVAMLVLFVVMSFTDYRVTVDSNMFGEHYLELFMIIVGLAGYMYGVYRGISIRWVRRRGRLEVV
jgi:hypothetical protein